MTKQFRVYFQLIDDGEHVSSSAVASITDDERSEMEEGQSDDDFVGRKVKDALECDGFSGVSIVKVDTL